MDEKALFPGCFFLLMEPMMEELLTRMAGFVSRHALWRPGGRVLVACSGGPDSLALLSLVLALKETQKLEVWVAHFDHGIRGEAGCADAVFVADFAASHAVPCRVMHEDIPAYAAKHRLSLETAARERRYRFLRRTAAEMGPGTVIAIGHQAEDQAETVLMRILRGTGLRGLAAMRPRRGDVVRPLLWASRAEIEAYCLEKGLSPRQDATNGEMDAARNRIRLELMPLLRARYNPEITAALCRLADIAQDEEDFLQKGVDALWQKTVRFISGGWSLESAVFSKQPAALQEGLLRRLAEAMGEQMNFRFAHYEALKTLLIKSRTGAKIDLPGCWRGEMVYGVLRVYQSAPVPIPWKPKHLSVPGIVSLPEIRAYAEAMPVEALPTDLGPNVIAVDADVLPLPWEIRPRRDGDWLQVEHGTKKLKNLLIDAKIPRNERTDIPVFTANGQIFWVGGLRQAAWGRVTFETKRIVRLTLHQGLYDGRENEVYVKQQEEIP